MIKNTRFLTKGKKVLQITRHEIKELDKGSNEERIVRKNENTLFHQTSDIHRKTPSKIQSLPKKKPFRLQKRHFQTEQQKDALPNAAQQDILPYETQVSSQQQENVPAIPGNQDDEKNQDAQSNDRENVSAIPENQNAEIPNENKEGKLQNAVNHDSTGHRNNKGNIYPNQPLIAKSNKTKRTGIQTDNYTNIQKPDYPIAETPAFFNSNEQDIEMPVLDFNTQETNKQPTPSWQKNTNTLPDNTPIANKSTYQNHEIKPIRQPNASVIRQSASNDAFENIEPTAPTGSKPEPAKSIQKAEKKLKKIENQLEKAQQKIPCQGQFQSTEKQGARPTKYKTVPKKTASFAEKTVQKSFQAAASNTGAFLHRKIAETEKDNIGIEAAHKTEKFAEKVGSYAIQSAKSQQKKRPYQKGKQLEKKWHKTKLHLQYEMDSQKNVQGNKVSKKNPLSKFFLKRKIKRQYQRSYKQARTAGTTMRQTIHMNSAARKVIQKIAAKHFPVFALLAVILILFALLSSGLSSCSFAFTGGVSAIVSTSYTASDRDINLAEAYYCQLEQELQERIQSIESEHGGYDEYRKNIGNIGHNPYELMALLTALYFDFTFEDIKPEIERIFELQYPMEMKEVIEYRRDREGNYYAWYVLDANLSPVVFSSLCFKELANPQQQERYQVYLLSKGGRQYFASPFSFDWIPFIDAVYSDNSMDISVAAGCPVAAGKDGIVTQSGNGLVIIEDKHGYSAVYQGLSTITTAQGQTVKSGQTIGNADRNMRLSFSCKGISLNPYFFVASSGDAVPGLSGSATYPDNPGTPMGDGSYTALIAEAEKYLGYPYVFGGSSPSTSFDCSGFVCWVFTHSGVYNLSRTTAQGIYNQCTPVSPENAKPGDFIFFTGTYSTPNPVSHVGIYVGNGQMIHCGEPISYANINTAYWQNHFYSFGRLSGTF